MKCIVAVIFALGTVSAAGSGPYLPSGWRPQGPAFYLPGEVEKTQPEPVKISVVADVEASGSEGLREYGPPKVVATVQGLPDVVTDQSFYVPERSSAVEEEQTVTVRSGNVQEDAEEATPAAEAATEAQEAEVAEVAEVSEVTEAVTAAVEEATSASVEEKLEQIVVQEEKTLEQVQSISETLYNLEQEVKAEQVQEAVAELRTNQEESSSVSGPEGFLEYGPPGFKEYGPPKAIPLGVAPLQDSFENNEARRRRFSPKFKRSQKATHQKVTKRHH